MELVQEKYIQTEVGLIPSDWEVKNLDEITNVIDPHPSHRAPQELSNGIPFLGIGDFTEDGQIKKDNYRIVSREIFDEHKLRYNLNDELIGLGRVASIGKVIRFRNDLGEYTISPTMGILKPTNTTRDYLFQILKSEFVVQYFSKIMSGSTRSSVGMIVLRKIPIPLPSIEEQTTIATALSDADAWINSLEQLIAKKRLIKQGAMQELLQPKEGWEVKKLGEVCDVRDGTHESPKYFESGVTFITSKNIIKGKLDFKDISFISEEDAYLVNQRSKVDKGDILMSMIGTIGNAVLINFEPEFCIKNIALLKPKKINENFLIQLIHSASFQKYIESKLDGGIQKFISLGVLRELEIPVPPNKEQTRISTILSDMDAEITVLEEKLEKAKQIKLGMMQELLRGRIRLV